MSNVNPNDDNNPSDFNNLQANFNQQQAKIEALKEMLRKTEATQGKNTANAQEKVRNIAQRLTHLKAKARSRHEPDQPASKDVSEQLTMTTTSALVLTSSDDDDQQIHKSTSSIPTIPTTLTVTPHQQMVTRARSETPASDKILLLRKQMEQNRQKMAEHENTKRGIVEMVSQLRANIDDNQMNLEKSSQLGRSIGDLSKINKLSTMPLTSGGFRERNKSISDFNHHISTTVLSSTGTFNPTGIEKERLQFLERRVKELEIENKIKDHNFFNKNPESEHLKTIKNLENKIVDLEETLNSQQSIITARTQAVSLLSESLSLKGKSTVDMLEDTKQEMLKMQENFIQNESDFQLEKDRLKMDIEDRSKKIQNMEEINDILETAKFDLTIENGELRKKLDNEQDYTIKINELNKLNDSLQQRILQLEKSQHGGNVSVSDDNTITEEDYDENVQLSKKVNIEQLLMVKTLEDQIEKLKLENAQLLKDQSSSNVETNIIEIDVQEKIDNLEQTINKQRLTIEEHLHKITQLEDTIVEKSIEYNVLNVNYNVLQEKFTATTTPKPLFSMTTDENAEMEITKLKSQLDDANKNMIKMKLTSKQLQKQIDTLKKSSDINTELVKRTEENQRLQIRLTELENERKHMHTQTIDINANANKNDLEQKIQILETTCQNQNSAIQLLEEQKLDINDDLQTTKSELTTLKDRIRDKDNEEQSSENVIKHMDSIEMEETVEKYSKEIDLLKLRCDKLTNENYDLNHRLARHVTENIELLDKIEKLNKGSSAESIEIVERLTQQEKLEIEQYLTVKQSQEDDSKQTQRVSESSNDSKNNPSDNPIPTINVSEQMENNTNVQTKELNDINENLQKLREENSELIYKIKLFTDERREVLDKMEIIQNENHHYLQQIDELNGIKKEQEEDFILLEREKFNAVESLKSIEIEKDTLLQTIREINQVKAELKEEINRLVKERETAAAIITTGSTTNNNDRLSFIQQELSLLILKLSNDNNKKSLQNLEIELDNYRKTKDKNGKLHISRKLAKEAENIHILMGTLLKGITNIEQQLKEAQTTTESNDNNILNQNQITVNETQIDLHNNVKELQQQLEEYKLKLIESEKVEIVMKLEIETLMGEMQYQEKMNENKTLMVAEKLATVQDEYQKLKPTFDEQTVELQKLRNEYENHMIVTTNEISILTKLVDEQKQQLIESITEHESELNEKLLCIDKLENQLKQLTNELRSIKNDKQQSNDKYIESLHKKVESLKLIFDENNDLLTQQAKELEYKQETIQTLNSQIMDLYRSMEEQTVNLYETKDEIERLETIIKQNRIEYDQLKAHQNDSVAEIERLTNTVKEKLIIIENLQETKNASMKENEPQNIIETKLKENLLMSDEKTDLEKNYTNLQKKNQDQLEKLKKFAITLKKKNAQYLELEEKFKNLENDHKRKNNEFDSLETQLKDRITELNVIQSELIKSQDNINLLKMENNKIENTLQQSDAVNLIEIENQLQRLENENLSLSEQIANQTNYITELKTNNDTLKNDIDNLNKEMSNKLKLMEEQTKAYAVLQKDCEDKEKLTKQKIEKCKQILREKNKEIKNLKEQKAIENVPTVTTSPIAESESVQSEANCQEHHEKITTLQDTINELQLKIETIQTGNEGKVQENLMVIETLELEKINLQEKCIHLEEEMCTFESQRSLLEQELETINQKLQDQSNAFEENEKELIERVHNLVEQDKQMENKLKDCEQERDELLNEMHEAKDMAKQQLNKIQTLENELKYLQEIKLDQFEKECTTLTNDNKTLQMEVQRLTNVLLKKEQDNQNDFKQLEYDMSIQLQSLNTERKQLQENIERFNETVSEQNQEINRLKEHVQNLEQENQLIKLDLDNINYDQNEMSNLRMQIIHDQTEIDNLKSQNYSIIQNHESELQALRLQITELDTLRMQVGQNQTDDQVFIQNENERLHQLLIEREQEIVNYKHMIEQHQQSIPQISTVSTATSTDFIDSEVELQNFTNNLNLNDNDVTKMNIESILNPVTEDINQTENIPSFNSSIFFDSTAMTNTTPLDQNIQQQDFPEQIIQTTSKITKHELENQLGNVFSYLEKQEESDSMSTIKINKDELQNIKSELELYQLKDQENSIKIFEFENDRKKTAIQIKDMENKINEIVSKKTEQIELDLKERNSSVERLQYLQQKVEGLEMQKNELENIITSLNIKFADSLHELQMKCTEIEELQCREREYQEKSLRLENQLKQYENEKVLSNIEQLIVPVKTTENQQINVVTKDDSISPLPPTSLITSDLPSFNSSIFFNDTPSDFNIQPLITPPPQQQIQSDGFPTNIHSTADETDENRIPVVEEIIVPKKSYICHPEEQMSIDDGKYIQNVGNLKTIALSETEQYRVEQEEHIADLKRQIDDREKHLGELKIQFDNMNQFHNQKLSEFESYCSMFNEREQQYITRINLIEMQLKQFENKNAIELAPKEMIIPIVHASESDSVNILPSLTTADPNTDNLPSFNSSAFFNNNNNNETSNDFMIDHLENAMNLEKPQQQTLPQQSLFNTDNTEEDEYANRLPIQEEIIIPKKAYVCQPNIDDENKQMNPNEEGWGWGSDEAILDEQHQQTIAPTITASLIPSTSQTNFDIKLQESEDKIQELELERDRLREETIALKVKSGKMLKKLKEYQQRDNKAFKKSPSVESNELDIAIQDELKNQINVLELKLNEIRLQQDKEKLEKSQLQKRIDVLSTANENMIDIKERQDIEMQINHSKIKELTMKLKQLEDWDDNQDINSETPKSVQNVRIPQTNIVQSLSEQQRPALSNDTYEELQKHINDLSTDNEEFQALLEDEKQMNKLLESKLNQLQSSLMLKCDVEQNYQESLDKIQKLENSNQLMKYTVQECEQENENLKIKVTKLEEQIQTIDELSKESTNIGIKLNQLKIEHFEKICENTNLLKEHQLLTEKNTELSNEIEQWKSLMNQKQHLSAPAADQQLLHEQCEMKIQELLAALQYKESEILHLNKKIVDVQQQDQTESLVQEILLKNGEIQQLKLNINELQKQLDHNQTDLENLTIIQELRVEIKKLGSIQMGLVSDKEHMEKELQELNEQVLKSFDMEDRVKKCALDLDMKNIEIIELKNTIEEQRKRQFASPINELNQTKTIPTNQSSQSIDNSNNNDLIMKLQERIKKLENDITEKDQCLQTTMNELNVQWEEICERRCSELADSWRQHLMDREQEFSDIENDLQQQINKLSSSTSGGTINNNASTITTATTTTTMNQNDEPLSYNQSQSTQLQQIIDDKETYINNLQVALENQEIEIVTLKEQLAIRSAEYARIAAHIDPFRQLSSSNFVQQASPSSLAIGQSLMSPSNEILNTQNINNSNGRGLQQKFDFALYLLHQSDMRYQELTEELKKLLEERDTLQLRLSNSIRQIEDYRNGKGSQNPSNVTTPEKLTNSNDDLNNETIAKSQDNLNLTAKLLQLNTVNHLRDKRLLEERDQHQRHMSILQQDVDNIPEEAMAELFGADYNLQRPSPQSSSSFLSNWFWGISTSPPMAPTPQKQMPPN